MPRRVAAFGAWLRERGEAAPTVIGDNWYEVERASAQPATTACDERPSAWTSCRPRDAEFAAVDALAGAGPRGAGRRAGREADRTPDVEAAVEPSRRRTWPWPGSLAVPRTRQLGTTRWTRLYAARDALTDALEQAGPAHDGVRRVLRLAIADDLRLADRLRGGGG